MHACVSLATIAMVTTSAGGPAGAFLLVIGSVFSLLSVGLMVYAYRTFLWRADRIRERVGGRTDDPKGPTFLSAAMLLAIALCVCVTIDRGRWV